MLRHVDTLRSAVYGTAVGDALGLPVQFLPRDSYPEVTEMTGSKEPPCPAGTWSDDTSMTLATCDAIRRRWTAFLPAKGWIYRT